MNLLLIAPSGGGKGTVADYIRKEFGIPHISTGDIFRDNVARKTELGLLVDQIIAEGAWVPDDIVMEMLRLRLLEPDCKHGFVLDGTPRSIRQAEILDENFRIDLVMELDVPDEVVVERLGGRWVCSACNKNHNVILGSIEKCRACGKSLYQREDDKEVAIRRRLAQYHASIQEIKKYYQDQGIFCTVSVSADERPDRVYEKVRAQFEKRGLVN